MQQIAILGRRRLHHPSIDVRAFPLFVRSSRISTDVKLTMDASGTVIPVPGPLYLVPAKPMPFNASKWDAIGMIAGTESGTRAIRPVVEKTTETSAREFVPGIISSAGISTMPTFVHRGIIAIGTTVHQNVTATQIIFAQRSRRRKCVTRIFAIGNCPTTHVWFMTAVSVVLATCIRETRQHAKIKVAIGICKIGCLRKKKPPMGDKLLL